MHFDGAGFRRHSAMMPASMMSLAICAGRFLVSAVNSSGVEVLTSTACAFRRSRSSAAAGEAIRALGDRFGDPLFDADRFVLADERADDGLLVTGIPVG